MGISPETHAELLELLGGLREQSFQDGAMVLPDGRKVIYPHRGYDENLSPSGVLQTLVELSYWEIHHLDDLNYQASRRYKDRLELLEALSMVRGKDLNTVAEEVNFLAEEKYAEVAHDAWQELVEYLNGDKERLKVAEALDLKDHPDYGWTADQAIINREARYITRLKWNIEKLTKEINHIKQFLFERSYGGNTSAPTSEHIVLGFNGTSGRSPRGS